MNVQTSVCHLVFACIAEFRKPRKTPSVVWVCASWGAENHAKNIVSYGFVPLGGAENHAKNLVSYGFVPLWGAENHATKPSVVWVCPSLGTTEASKPADQTPNKQANELA